MIRIECYRAGQAHAGCRRCRGGRREVRLPEYVTGIHSVGDHAAREREDRHALVVAFGDEEPLARTVVQQVNRRGHARLRRGGARGSKDRLAENIAGVHAVGDGSACKGIHNDAVARVIRNEESVRVRIIIDARWSGHNTC